MNNRFGTTQERKQVISHRGRTLLRHCSDIYKCSEESRNKCGAAGQNESCWFSLNGCICPAIKPNQCYNCRLYEAHSTDLGRLKKSRSLNKNGKLNRLMDHIDPIIRNFIVNSNRDLPVSQRRIRIIRNFTCVIMEEKGFPEDVPFEKYFRKFLNEVFPKYR